MKIRISDHAREQMEIRKIPAELVEMIANCPDQQYDNASDETVCQSKMPIGGKTYIVRVFVNFKKNPPAVISVYRTSKIDKYWRD